MSDERPAQPVSLPELAEIALSRLTPEAADYVFGAAGTEDTMRANEAAFRRWRIVPRMLRDVSHRDLARHRARHRDAGSARPRPHRRADDRPPRGRAGHAPAPPPRWACRWRSRRCRTITLEDVAAAADGPKWFQLYWPRDRELAASLVSRAEAAGYTRADRHRRRVPPRLEAARPHPRLAALPQADRHRQLHLGSRCSARCSTRSPEEDPLAAIGTFVAQFTNPGLAWDDLEFLRSRTTLPIALKGVLHPDDARLAREHGMDAIIVSNHGGRQVDGAIAALDALPAIVDAVGGELDVLLDSGVRARCRRGQGAGPRRRRRAARPPLPVGAGGRGEAGVLAVLRGMLAEIDLTVGLCGYTRPAELNAGLLVREPA